MGKYIEENDPAVRRRGLQTQKDGVFEGNISIGGNLSVTGTTLSDRAVTDVTASTLAVTAAESGTLYSLNRAAGIAVTLPAATAGLWYDFAFITSVTSNTTTITASAGDLYIGLVVGVDTDTSNAVFLDDPDGTDDVIMTFNGTTQGGLVGTRIRVEALSDARWLVSGQNRQSGIVATIFS